jgi:PAP2 superfamily
MNRLGAFLVLAAIVLVYALPHPLSGGRAATDPTAVITWNMIAQRTAITNAQLFQTESMIYISFVQAAVYDAVVAITGGYQPYKLDLARRPRASVDAAVATAAHHVLVHYFPKQQVKLDTDYADALAVIPAGGAKDDGIAVGQEAAAGVIALREGDGRDADIGFAMPPAAPGVWQLPPNQTPQTPWVSKLKPFMLNRPDQFRPGPPPELTSSEWAVQFNEVKQMGRSDNATRSADQTDIARFWSTNAVVQYNTAFKQIVQARGLDTMQAARLFAMGNLVGADALIGCFDAKYHYLFWRPQFAIPQGESDGNPATAGDPTWTPLLPTPNHPEYPSAHGCLTAAEAEVFAAYFGTNRIEIDLTSTIPNLTRSTRHYARVTDLVQEIIDARVWGGIHYRVSVVKGVDLGRRVAHWTLQRYFQPAAYRAPSEP